MENSNNKNNVCDFCKKEFKTKNTLKSHLERSKKCLSRRGKKIESTFCCICKHISMTKNDHEKHIKSCETLLIKGLDEQKLDYIKKESEFNRIIEQKETEIKNYKLIESKNLEYIKLIDQKDLEIRHYKEYIKKLEELLEKSNKTIEYLAEKAIEKPTVNTTNIKTQNIQTVLTDSNIYDKNTEHERILDIARNKIENYFWQGQKGIAKFCLDHIVKTEDGKMIICCTDPSRKRFKYMNADKELSEDIEARIFTKKISVPIQLVCEEVFNNIVRKLEDEKDTDTSDAGFLNIKKEMAWERFIEIKDINDNKKNIEYKNELCTLLNV